MKPDEKEIVQKLLEYGNELLEKEDNLVENTKNKPISFFLCCLADKRNDADLVWGSLNSELEKYKDEDILNFNEVDCEKILKDAGLYKNNSSDDEEDRKSQNQLAKEIYGAIKKIKRDYDGKIEKLWENSHSYAEMITKFLEFDGIGCKIANMATILLKRHFGINKFKDEHFIDIATDTHVCYVFKHLKLIKDFKDEKKISDKDKDMVIYKARALNPSAPYLLDKPCFEIGRNYCKKRGKKDCPHCPMEDICKRLEN